jgi:uncharacterized protein affecting Mg2+/Co2+ transport
MEGSYGMLEAGGGSLDVRIPRFPLLAPVGSN